MKSIGTKILLLFLVLSMTLSAVGCRKTVKVEGNGSDYTSEYWITEEVEGEEGKTENQSGNSSVSSGKDTATESISSKPYKPSGNKLEFEGAGTDPDANYKVSGVVKVAVSSYRPCDYEAMLDAFSAVYPNVDLVLDYRPKHGADADETNHYLASRAMAGNMPDVVFDDAGRLPNYLVQGWVYPLDELVKNDKAFKNIPTSLIENYTYLGKLYALPHQAHFSGVVLNLDAFDELNMDIPSLSWNMKELESVLKAGTTDKFSGCEYLGAVPSEIAGSFSKDAGPSGYNVKTKKFDMASTFGAALKLNQNLRKNAGLEAYSLRSNINDYISKFGNGNTSVADMAFKLGRTLVHFEQGTWAIDNLNSICKFNWKLYPYPQAIEGRIPVHIDHCFMTTSANNLKNPDAAFQVLRYMTYSTEGNLARLSMYDANNKDKYALNSRIFYPTVATAEVAAKFKSLPDVTDVDIYFFENIGNGYRSDLLKIVPGWEDVGKIISGVLEGKDNADVDSIIPSLQTKANSEIGKKWSDFETKLKKVQSEFKG